MATLLLIVSSTLIGSPALGAQGVQTGSLTGTVKSQDGLTVPGATVTVTSPALQGSRTSVTDENGIYLLRSLPPGLYTVTFEMSGMATATEMTQVPLGSIANLDVTLALARLQESVSVVAEVPSPLVVPTAGANYRATEVNILPMGRTPFLIAELAPGLTDNTPNASQVTISGAFAYDNVFMVDGVDINDNIFGNANGLFIEEAVEETQVLTSGISAEWGRFSGGVINLITKHGGNTFSGAARMSMTNPSWSQETPFEKSSGVKHRDLLSKYYEGTLGGPIMRDRLWFFVAGRSENSKTAQTFRETGVPNTLGVDNKRGEVKLTGTLAPNHTIQGSFVNNPTEQSNRASLNITLSVDPAVVVTRQTPNHIFVTTYSGVVGSKSLATVQYSEKKFGFRNAGGTSTDIKDSPFRTRGVLGVPATLHYNAPFFDSNDPEDRNNRQFTASVARSMSSRRLGSHDLKVGGEHYTATNTGGNSQTATGYVFQSDYVIDAAGKPVLDSKGHPSPRFVPGVSRVQNWIPTRGARIDIKTLSFYVNDRWHASDRWTFDLGTRYERVRSDATGDIVGVDTDTIVPRLGATFDVRGNGRTVAQATYAHYAGKYSEAQFSRNSDVGTPSRVTYGYTGPAGEGLDFAPGFNVANYSAVISGSFPTATVFFDKGLSSPITKEFTLSAGQEIGSRGHGKVTYTRRDVGNFIEDFLTINGGQTTVIRNGIDFGTFDNQIYRNSDLPVRKYQALQFVGRYRATSRLDVNGHWTVQLQNNGNFEGEAANQPGNASDLGDYPEILVPSRNFPTGRLDDFQRNKIRLWTIYNLDLRKAGTLDVAPIYKYNSGQTYSLRAMAVPLSAIQLARNPGYVNITPATTQTLYFAERGTENFKGYALFDLGLTYGVPVWKTVKPWIKVDLFDVFNNDRLISWDTTVNPDPASPRDEHGLPTGYIKGPNFGKATRNQNFPPPIPGQTGGRWFQMAFGMRF
jgi:hypothetical protein